MDIVANGKLAEIASLEKEYDLILMDQMMPVMDGFEAAKSIISRKSSGKMPIIIALTANASTDSMKEAEDIGISDFLTKPLNIVAFANTLKKWLVQ